MSAPSKPVQIIPPGLLGFLGVKNMGQLPDTLLGEYSPSIETGEWLMAANRTTISNANALGAGTFSTAELAGGNPITIPDREWWYVWNVSLRFALPNADTIQIPMVSVRNDAASVQQLAAVDYGNLVAPAGGLVVPVCCEPRRWFGPGTQFQGGAARLVVALACNYSLTAEFTRLPI